MKDEADEKANEILQQIMVKKNDFEWKTRTIRRRLTVKVPQTSVCLINSFRETKDFRWTADGFGFLIVRRLM